MIRLTISFIFISQLAFAAGTVNCDDELNYSTRSDAVVYFEYHTGRFVMHSVTWGYEVQLVEDMWGWHIKEIRGLINEAVMYQIRRDALLNGFGEIE